MLRLYRQRAQYWSCSEFANWIRRVFGGLEKPTAATLEEWAQYKIDAKAKNAVVNWITTEGLTILQDIVYFPYDVYEAIRIYLVNRFVDKTHYMQTKLPPGQWYDVDTRIVRGMFETLVDFVEIEKAWMCVAFSEQQEWEKYNYPRWYRYRFLRWIKRFRSAKAGIDHLNWEISLGEESPVQAQAAKEILALYMWWKHERPQRIDPYGVEGMSYEQINALEQMYDREDEEMLIRLVKVRKSLWT